MNDAMEAAAEIGAWDALAIDEQTAKFIIKQFKIMKVKKPKKILQKKGTGKYSKRNESRRNPVHLGG